MKEWIVDGEYYHKAKSKLKRLLGEYRFMYDWKEKPLYVWRRDKNTWIEGIFDREELPNDIVKRYAAKIVYNGVDNPEMFSLVDAWAKGHEVEWRLKEPTVDYLQVIIKMWRETFQSTIRIRKAPKGWVRAMTRDCKEKLKRLKRDIKEEKEDINIWEYVYLGV